MHNLCLTSGRASAILKSSPTPLHTPISQCCSSLRQSTIVPSTSSHNHPSIPVTSFSSHHRPRFCRSVVAYASFGSLPSVDIEEGKKLLDKGLVKFIDIRPRQEWDEEHIVKPPRSAFSVPFDEYSFVEEIASQFPNKATGLLVACTDGGASSARAVELLADAGYTGVKQVVGGYSAWTKVFSTSGRRKPPPGRWVSTGKEALKSGLTIPGAAESYEEGGNLKKARYAQGFAPNEAGLF